MVPSKQLSIETSAPSVLQGLPGSLPWGMFMTFLNDYFQQQYGISAGVGFGLGFGISHDFCRGELGLHFTTSTEDIRLTVPSHTTCCRSQPPSSLCLELAADWAWWAEAPSLSGCTTESEPAPLL